MALWPKLLQFAIRGAQAENWYWQHRQSEMPTLILGANAALADNWYVAATRAKGQWVR